MNQHTSHEQLTSPKPGDAPARERLTRWAWRIALLWLTAYALVVVVVTLVPADINWTPQHLFAQWRHALATFSHPTRSPLLLKDIASNFMLYLPLGIFAAAALAHRHRWLGLALGPLLSLLLETAQIPTDRYPSAWDWVANSGGYFAGYGVTLAAMVRYHLSIEALLSGPARTAQTLPRALLMIYLPLLILLSWLPFDVATGPSTLWAQLHAGGDISGRILLNPLAPWHGERLASLGVAFSLLMPVGFLTGLGSRRSLAGLLVRAAWIGLAISLAIETGQAFVLSRTTDMMQVVAAALGTLAGAAAGWGWRRLIRQVEEADETQTEPAGLAEAVAVALVVYVLITLVAMLWPLEFLASAREAGSKLIHESYWLPLEAYAWRRSLADWRDLAGEIAWFIPLGLLGWTWLRLIGCTGVRWISMLAVALIGWGILIELAQVAVVGRTVDATDMLSHAVGAGFGMALGWLFLRGARGNRR